MTLLPFANISNKLESVKTTKSDKLPDQSTAQLAAILATSPEITLVGHAGGELVSVPVPETLRRALQELLPTALAEHSGTRTSARRQLTTQEAADALGVSRPTVISLLDEFEIPFSLVGRHRRLDPEHVALLRSRLREKRSQQLDVMRELSRDIGEYEADPADNPLVHNSPR
jgi:excisionase family DNA binding protein